MQSSAYVFIGDHSRSNSEIWDLNVGGANIAASDYGVVSRETVNFKMGESYSIDACHISTNRDAGPDYDYRAWIDDSSRPRWTSGASTPSGDEFFVTDDSGLLQKRHFSGPDSGDPTSGKSATIHFPSIDLDIDSDNSGALNGSLTEDYLETNSAYGKVIPVMSGDLDGDGVEDLLDFDGILGASFTQVNVALSANLAAASASNIDLAFEFDDATLDAYTDGLFRLWTKDAPQFRSASDLIMSGQSISASSLGLSPGGSITLYLEAVNPTRRTVHYDPIEVLAQVSGNEWSGELEDGVYARGREATVDPEIISVEYVSDEGQQLVGIYEGSILPVSGTVKYRRDVPSVEVEVWADLNFDGIRDNLEVNAVQATQTDSSDVDGDRYYAFETSFFIVENSPPFDSLKIIVTPYGGKPYNSSILALNADPYWVDYPTLNPTFNEHGVIVRSSLSGTFSDPGTQDYHGVQVLVDGIERTSKLLNQGAAGFSVDVGVLTPGSGEQITVKLLDDDLGSTTFYITLSTVVSKSFIANLATTGGAGTVSSRGGLYPEEAALATARLAGFAAGTIAGFRENPGSAFSENDFRLYSRDVYSVGFDGDEVKYYERLSDGSAMKAGYEIGTVVQGTIEEQGRYRNLTSSTTGTAGVLVHGHPDPNLEISFNRVMNRTSTDIWYKLDVAFAMQGNFATFSVVDTNASAFPSNRVWIDAAVKVNYQQSTVVKLWQSSPTLGSLFVVGRDETGLFQDQFIYGTGLHWKPVED